MKKFLEDFLKIRINSLMLLHALGLNSHIAIWDQLLVTSVPKFLKTLLEQVWTEDGRTVLFVTHDVEEALVLSDRVVVLSPRPGRVVTTVDCPWPRPRPADLVTQTEVVARKAELLRALDQAPA